jgi:hypothetical protein
VETLYFKLLVDITRDGVGESGDGDSTDGKGRSWLEFEVDPEPVLAAFTALARVVTISSLKESFENCSTDMKTVVPKDGCRVGGYILDQHRQLHATILNGASTVSSSRCDTDIIKGRLVGRPSVPYKRWGVNRLWLSG